MRYASIVQSALSTNLTIRNVPDALSRKLKQRAERNHRSLQGEVMAILEQTALADSLQQPAKTYRARSHEAPEGGEERLSQLPRPNTPEARLTIEQIWERGKRLGVSTPNESARIVRKLRDGRRGR
jgi:plasmid stability protein